MHYVFLKKKNMVMHFKNLTIGIYILYVLNMNVKFYTNQMLFTFRFTNLLFMHNFMLQKFEI